MIIGPALVNNGWEIMEVDAFFTFTAGGTLSLLAAQNSAGKAFDIWANTTMDVVPA